jgi:hypothetical protein
MTENKYQSSETPLASRSRTRRSPLFTILMVAGGLFTLGFVALVVVIMSVEIKDATIELPAKDASSVPVEAG